MYVITVGEPPVLARVKRLNVEETLGKPLPRLQVGRVFGLGWTRTKDLDSVCTRRLALVSSYAATSRSSTLLIEALVRILPCSCAWVGLVGSEDRLNTERTMWYASTLDVLQYRS